MSEIRIIHPKEGAIKVEVDGKAVHLPPPGQDVVISVRNINWAIRQEHGRDLQDI